MADGKRESPEEFGRRLAGELLADYGRSKAQADQVAHYLNNRDAAQRHVQATGGTAQDARLMVFQAGSKQLAPPRPRLVTSEG